MNDQSARAPVGIFADERVLQFYNVIRKEIETIFGQLWDICKSRDNCESLWTQSLQRIAQWSHKTQVHEAAKLLERHPNLLSLYKYSVVAYVKALYANETENKKLQIRMPPFDSFLHEFFIQIAESTEFKDHLYWKLPRVSTAPLIQDSIREALTKALENHITEDRTYDWLQRETMEVDKPQRDESVQSESVRFESSRVPPPTPAEEFITESIKSEAKSTRSNLVDDFLNEIGSVRVKPVAPDTASVRRSQKSHHSNVSSPARLLNDLADNKKLSIEIKE